MRILSLFILLFVFSTLNAQVDSLKSELLNCKSDSSFAKTYLLIARTFLNNNNDSVLYYVEKAKPYLSDYTKGKGSAKNIIATVEFRKGNYEKSRILFLEALDYAIQLNDSLKMGAYLNNAGLTNTYQGNHEEALVLLMKALTIRERINDPKISSTYNNIGVAYERLEQLEKATRFQLLALKEKEQQGNSLKISNTLNNLGIIYRDREMYDSSFYYYDRALKAALLTENKAQISNAYNNLGSLFFGQEELDSAEKYYTEAVIIKKALGKSFELRNSYSNLCVLHIKKGNLAKAKNYYELAEAQKDSTDSKSSSLSQLKLKVKLETALGDYEEALKSSNEVFQLYKELINEENSKSIEELNTKYETEKKEKEISLLNLKNKVQQTELEQSRLMAIGFIIGALLLLLILVIIYNLYRLKQKTNKLLTHKNEELEEVNAVKDQLFSVVSHDLKNPVFAFKNLTGTLSQGFNRLPKEKVQDLMVLLNSTSSALYDSLNNILLWSLSQQNKITVNSSKINIKSLIEEVLLLHKMNIDEKNIRIENSIDPNLMVESDPNILSTVLRNVLMNAIKFSPISGTITITNENNRISITDKGMGMSASDISKLFDIKNDVQSIGNSPNKGTGLGLILCKELLEKVNGKIEVESEINKGTAVTILLP